jgi:hypothetical protein
MASVSQFPGGEVKTTAGVAVNWEVLPMMAVAVQSPPVVMDLGDIVRNAE